MELKDFVSATLVQIFEGVKGAQEQLEDLGNHINPLEAHLGAAQKQGIRFGYNRNPIQDVEFDVAVTVTENAGVGAKIGVSTGMVSATLGGSGQNSKESVNRIKFTVPVCLPYKKDR